jgi:hypothetical protein
MTNPTKSFQSQVRKDINNSKTLINLNSKWKHINLNPTAPFINQITQTGTPNSPCGQFERSSSIKINPSIYPENQGDDPTTQHT